MKGVIRRLLSSLLPEDPALIRLYPSGALNNLLDPNDLPSIEDTAWHLSQIGRFTGGTRVFYSVAEHAVRASRLSQNYPLETLVHDNEEATFGDVNRPLKNIHGMGRYRKLTVARREAIFRALGLVWPEPDEVHEIDARMYEYERLILLSAEYENYLIPGQETLGPLGWSPVEARTRYLARFEALMRQRAEDESSLVDEALGIGKRGA